MYLLINALILALLVPTGGAQFVREGPACRAEVDGLSLKTVVELPMGVAVEGPWRIQHQPARVDGEKIRLLATLDHVVETNSLTGDRNVIPFPHQVRLAFEGTSSEDAVRNAARVWCATVIRAQENRMLDHLEEPTHSLIA